MENARFAGVSCGGEHTLFVDSGGVALSAGACGLGWDGRQLEAMEPRTLKQRARPCHVAAKTFLSLFGSAPGESGRVEKVVGGYYHSLALSRCGRLFSWGCGAFDGTNDGQLGRGNLQDDTEPAEVILPGLQSNERVVDAVAGCYHSAVLTSSRRVYTFGLNNYGQLARNGIAPEGAPVPRSPGDAFYNDPTPVALRANIMDVKAIGAGFYNLYLLTRGGGVRCAGSNAALQCGSAAQTHASLESVPELQNIILSQVVGGYCHTLALDVDGAVYSLGCGEDGQRGDARPLDIDDDSTQGNFKPTLMTAVKLPGHAKAVAAGANHSLAVSADGRTLWGWGSNEHGQLSSAAYVDNQPVDEGCSQPAEIRGLGLRGGETIVYASAGYAHSAILTDTSRVLTFGRGENGQLGSGQAEDTLNPVEVQLATGLVCGHS